MFAPFCSRNDLVFIEYSNMGHESDDGHNLHGISTRSYRFSCYKLPRDLDGNIHKKVPTANAQPQDWKTRAVSGPGLIKGGSEFEAAIKKNAK